MYAYLYIHSCINLCRFLEAVKCLSPSIDIWLHIILTAQPVLPRRRWFTTFIAPILPAHLRSPWAACALLRHTTVSSLGPLTSDDPWGVELFISCPAGDSHPSMKVFISPTFHDLSCFLLMTGWPLRVTPCWFLSAFNTHPVYASMHLVRSVVLVHDPSLFKLIFDPSGFLKALNINNI